MGALLAVVGARAGFLLASASKRLSGHDAGPRFHLVLVVPVPFEGSCNVVLVVVELLASKT
jgi:hypothetical protein